MPASHTASKKKAAPVKAVKKTASVTRKEGAGTLFAVIETGGKQYQVAAGDIITIELLKEARGKETGTKILFDKVLLVDNGKDTQIGDPYLKGATVEGVLQEEGKGRKIRVLRYKAKSRYLKQKGHRQPFVKVKIVAIK